jgi:hypothetical protein
MTPCGRHYHAFSPSASGDIATQPANKLGAARSTCDPHRRGSAPEVIDPRGPFRLRLPRLADVVWQRCRLAHCFRRRNYLRDPSYYVGLLPISQPTAIHPLPARAYPVTGMTRAASGATHEPRPKAPHLQLQCRGGRLVGSVTYKFCCGVPPFDLAHSDQSRGCRIRPCLPACRISCACRHSSSAGVLRCPKS